MKMQMILAGHGGQGVLEMANYISYLGLLSGRHVAYTPSYGPESRGGKVKCYVVISDAEIDSPIVEEPDYLVCMNIPSMDFAPMLKRGGTLLMNSSLIPQEPSRDDITLVKIPATEIAIELRASNQEIPDTRIAANTVMLGAFLAVSGRDRDVPLLQDVFKHFLTDRKERFIKLNLEAAKHGFEYAKDFNRIMSTI